MLALMAAVDELDDGELLARVASGAPSVARAAQSQFYRRHVSYLYAAVSKHLSSLLALSRQSAEDLVHDTFERAFARAETFSRDGIVDPERLRRRARAWLARIAHNLLANTLAAPAELPDSVDEDTLIAVEPPSEASCSRELDRLTRALDALSEREQDVLRVSALYLRVGEPHQRLPNAVAAELASRWQTTSDNVRAIRSRAMKKLREHLDVRSTVSEDEQ
jgi:RNA polymerase sigma factor (sigma-70 family)